MDVAVIHPCNFFFSEPINFQAVLFESLEPQGYMAYTQKICPLLTHTILCE